jgi:hypothetical protein
VLSKSGETDWKAKGLSRNPGGFCVCDAKSKPWPGDGLNAK